MTTLQATKDPVLRGVSPTPSKIPVRSQRRPPLPTVKPCALDQENQDPKRLVQKPNLDSAGPGPKVTHQTEKSERSVGSTQLRNPLEELRPSPGGQNAGPRHPPQTEAPGTVEFVADPAALATILSGEGVKSCRLGRQPSLAQRVLIRGSQGGTTRRGQGARASAYLAPRTPAHRLDPARASCFSRLEGPGPRGRTLCSQRLEALIPPSGPSFHPSAHPSFLELRRVTGGSSRTSVSQTSGLLLETPVPPGQQCLPPDILPWPSGATVHHPPITLWTSSAHTLSWPLSSSLYPSLQRMGVCWARGEHSGGIPARSSSWSCSAILLSPQPSYSVLRRLAIRPKTQFTPIRATPRVQQAQGLSGLSPQSCPEEPALPWEQIAVRLFDQESCTIVQEGPRKAPVAASDPSTPATLQELKMQRISILQELLRQEVEGLAGGKCAPLNGGSSLEMVELQPLLAEISRTRNAPEQNSGALHLPGLFQRPGLPEPCVPEECGEAQPCPEAKPEAVQPCLAAEPGSPESSHSREPGIPEPSVQEQPVVSEPCPPVEPGHLQADSHRHAGLLEPSPRIEPGASKACFLEPRSPESSPQPCHSQWAPEITTLIFSSQHPLCASPPIHSLQSLRPPTGQAGPSSLAPRTLALRQRLKACLTAIHCFHEARLDDECAFYTSRAPPSGSARVCTNPVATLLEWQDALCFIPVGSAAPQDSLS
ncbi:tastin isoform X1 [Lontra canadensis]|uniref:tastin isoform X1 n=1 Tax=Lontra canadensis TaxID=76717 RepID=UPI0013F2F904|nr:tastin isoform X1 [Lontra canadensis]XP_032732760.1 tastin isoform X1 [Lontra canadensis]XP_032732761.1 tastin isoform X1 [Lontra canadensis]